MKKCPKCGKESDMPFHSCRGSKTPRTDDQIGWHVEGNEQVDAKFTRQLETELQQKSEELEQTKKALFDSNREWNEQLQSLTKSNHAMREALEQINVYVEGYVDGAPDASSISKLANAVNCTANAGLSLSRCIELEKMK